MKLSLVPLSDKDAEKLKQALNTSPEFGKLLECIEAELDYNLNNVAETIIGTAVVASELPANDRLKALDVLRLQSAVEVLNEFLEPDYKLHTLDIEK